MKRQETSADVESRGFHFVGKEGLKGKPAMEGLSSMVGVRSWMSGVRSSSIKQKAERVMALFHD